MQQVDSQHPLAINIKQKNDQLTADNEENQVKKSPNSRRRRRGCRRHSTLDIPEIHEPFPNPNTESDPFLTVSRNHRKSSSARTNEDKGSPAFQSLVDIIHEMKRLPSISPTKEDTWKRDRRHSEPPQELKQPDHLHGKHVFTNSFLALEEVEECENNNDLVSPLLLPSSNRSRSKSVPNNVLPPTHDQSTSTRRSLYPAHLPAPEASAAVRAHTLFSGILRVDAQDSSEAFVQCEELEGASIYIFGSRNRNRALDGDEVAVELVDVDDMLHEKQAKRQARHTRRLSVLSTSHPTLSSISEMDQDAFEVRRERPKYCGKVVCILERPRNMLFSGTLSLYRPHAKTLDNASRDKKETHSPKIIWFIPADKRLPLVAVPIKHAPADFLKYHEEYKNRIFIGMIQRWPASSLHPFGLIEKEVGWMGELGVHSGALMADHHIRDLKFSDTVQKAAAAVPASITDQERYGRRDLTKESIFTMGKRNEDMDYAFSITSTDKGMYEVGIHITDVSNYVRLNTPLDREARDRSCVVHLADKKIPILPCLFMESHCSLGIIDRERLAFSILCRFTENGVLLHDWIGKTIIKSKGHVDLPLTDDNEELQSDASSILKICEKLQQNRLEKLNGASLAKSRQVFKLAESGYPKEIDQLVETDKDVLLQELLIVANFEVGQKITSRFPDQALLYRQCEPKLSQLVVVRDYFDNGPLTDSINGLLALAKKEASWEKQQTLIHVIKQNTPPSKYFSAGSLDISKYRHWNFGASLCTMVTEPMHNYASIFVQRQLSAALKGEEQENDNFDNTDKIARHCNSSYLSKEAAEEDSKKLYTAAYIYSQCLNTDVKQISTEAFATRVETDVVYLYIPEYDLELPVVMNEKSLPGGQHHYDSILNEMKIVYDNSEDSLQVRFMTKLYINIHVDLKVVRPVFDIEITK